jgi:hypothetical protein
MDWFHHNGKNQTLMAIHFCAHGFPGLTQSTLLVWFKADNHFVTDLLVERILHNKEFRLLRILHLKKHLVIGLTAWSHKSLMVVLAM